MTDLSHPPIRLTGMLVADVRGEIWPNGQGFF
jgi:hypothetical protein